MVVRPASGRWHLYGRRRSRRLRSRVRCKGSPSTGTLRLPGHGHRRRTDTAGQSRSVRPLSAAGEAAGGRRRARPCDDAVRRDVREPAGDGADRQPARVPPGRRTGRGPCGARAASTADLLDRRVNPHRARQPGPRRAGVVPALSDQRLGRGQGGGHARRARRLPGARSHGRQPWQQPAHAGARRARAHAALSGLSLCARSAVLRDAPDVCRPRSGARNAADPARLDLGLRQAPEGPHAHAAGAQGHRHARRRGAGRGAWRGRARRVQPRRPIRRQRPRRHRVPGRGRRRCRGPHPCAGRQRVSTRHRRLQGAGAWSLGGVHRAAVHLGVGQLRRSWRRQDIRAADA